MSILSLSSVVNYDSLLNGNSTVSNLSGRLNVVEANVTLLNATVANVSGRVSAVESINSMQQDNLNRLNTTVANVSGSVSILESWQPNVTAALLSITGTLIPNLNATVANLSAGLALSNVTLANLSAGLALSNVTLLNVSADLALSNVTLANLSAGLALSNVTLLNVSAVANGVSGRFVTNFGSADAALPSADGKNYVLYVSNGVLSWREVSTTGTLQINP